MNTVHFWQQLAYSLAGLVVGFVVGRYLPRKPKPITPAEERRVASRRAEDSKRDIPRTLTIMILIMMVLSVGGVVENQISKSHLRDQQHRDTVAALERNAAVAENARQLALRVKEDETLLFRLIVRVSKARSSQDVKHAIHKFIRQSRKVDSRPLPGVPPTPTVTSTTSSSSYTPRPTPSASHRPTHRPRSTHPPPKRTHHPKPTRKPVHVPTPPAPLPPQVCLPPFGPVICNRGVQ